MDTNWLYVLLQKNTADPLERLKLGNVILTEVSQRKVSPHPKLVNDFLDVMSGWLTGSNFKVTTIGLEIMTMALRTSPEVLASYYFDRLAVLIERMGDAKPAVRELAINLCLQLAYLENSSPVMLLDRLCVVGTGFEHKQWLVKVGSLTILREFLSRSFALVIQQSIALIPQMCRLTNDPNMEVRDSATLVLVDLMVFGGRPIIAKIEGTRMINEQKMASLVQRYQTTLATRGDLPPKHSIVMETAQLPRNSLIRRSLRSPAKITYPSARLSTPPRTTAPMAQTSPTTASPLSLPNSQSQRPSRDSNRSSVRAPAGMSISRFRSSSAAPAQCAVSQEDFRKAFSAVPKTTIYSPSDIRDKLELAKSVLTNPNEDWSKRANQLKLIRSIVINCDESIDRRLLVQSITELSDALDQSIRDLRSQIVREAAVTCSFLFETFGMDLRIIAEQVLPGALSQVAVSTKIMASSAATLSIFIIQRIPTRQVFKTLSDLANSKSKEQRRHLANLIEIVITTWDSKDKQPILKQIGQVVQSAICDADGETRAAGRKAFVKLEQLHNSVADMVFKNLDPIKQKMLREGVSSSSSSLNSDRDNNNQKSSPQQNISQKFLSQRSASAVDTKAIGLIPQKSVTSISRPMNYSHLPKTSTSTSFSAVRSSGYGQQNRAKTPSDGFAATKSSSSSPSTSTIQTPIQRVASNLGNSSFVASLTQEQANSLQSAMDNAREEMTRGSQEDDEFLLSRPAPPIVEGVLRACASSSVNEKKEALRKLIEVVGDPSLAEFDCKSIGETLNRLLAEGNSTLIISILELISLFVKCQFRKLEQQWLKIAIGKLFAKMGVEALPNVKSALLATQKTFLQTFDPTVQLKAVCEFMCDPVHLLSPKSRLALLEYICILFEEVWPEDPRCLERDTALDTPYMRAAIRKMFAWMFDPRIGAVLMPACERLVCALFALNAADFTMMLGDLSPECRDWAYRILQLNGQQQQQNRQKVLQNDPIIDNDNNSNNNYKPCPLEPARTTYTYEKEYCRSSVQQYSSTTVYQRKPTAHLADSPGEQAVYVGKQVEGMRRFEDPEGVNEAMANLHGMMCEGTFTLWNQFFEELLDAVFQILSLPSPVIRKKLSLRILQKMCTAQASKLFDSTEVAISKVLHAAATSEDNTMSVAAEDCLRILATHLPLPRVIRCSRRILSQDDAQRAVLTLKMLTRVFQEIDVDELAIIVDDVAPCFVESYDSPSSSVRKSAVFGLVALVQRVGMPRMEPHLKPLNSSKLNLIDLYVGRAKSSESGTSSN